MRRFSRLLDRGLIVTRELPLRLLERATPMERRERAVGRSRSPAGCCLG